MNRIYEDAKGLRYHKIKNDDEYDWYTEERGVVIGDMRFIDGKIYYCIHAYRPDCIFLTYRCFWKAVDKQL